MGKIVLYVEDDKKALQVILKGLRELSDAYSIESASNGVEAQEVLKKKNVSLLITELKMPEMGGLELLSYVMEHNPALPCFVITELSTPSFKRKARDLGATEFLTKPLNIEELNKKILNALKGHEEGGVLRGVTLNSFTQLVELETKTCVIRLANRDTGEHGALFFKDGVIVDARSNGLKGINAANDIFLWNKVDISIQNSCPVKENKVNVPLQLILLNAMRLRDESKNLEKGNKGTQHKDRFDEKPVQKNLIERVKEEINGNDGISDIFTTQAWKGPVSLADKIGVFFRSGELKLCAVSDLKGFDLVLVPGDDDTVAIKLSRHTVKKYVIDALKSVTEE